MFDEIKEVDIEIDCPAIWPWTFVFLKGHHYTKKFVLRNGLEEIFIFFPHQTFGGKDLCPIKYPETCKHPLFYIVFQNISWLPFGCLVGKKGSPWPSLIFHMEFFSRLEFANLWKNFVFLSPSLSQVALLLSLHEASSCFRNFCFLLSSSLMRHLISNKSVLASRDLEILSNSFCIFHRSFLSKCLFLICQSLTTFLIVAILSLKVK